MRWHLMKFEVDEMAVWWDAKLMKWHSTHKLHNIPSWTHIFGPKAVTFDTRISVSFFMVGILNIYPEKKYFNKNQELATFSAIIRVKMLRWNCGNNSNQVKCSQKHFREFQLWMLSIICLSCFNHKRKKGFASFGRNPFGRLTFWSRQNLSDTAAITPLLRLP